MKIGDKVEYINKNRSEYIGDVGVIIDITKSTIRVAYGQDSKHTLHSKFNQRNYTYGKQNYHKYLRLESADPVKYKILKVVNARAIVHDYPCKDEYIRFVERFGLDDIKDVDLFQALYEEKDWEHWLVKGGYIEIYREVTYRQGDIIKYLDGSKDEYIIAKIGVSDRGLINLRTGNKRSNRVVAKYEGITYKDMMYLTGQINFQLIKKGEPI